MNCKSIAVISLMVLSLLFSGCASLTYQTADGSKVRYIRILTGSDCIKGQMPGAAIEVAGQQAIDPAALEAAGQALKLAK